MHLDAMKSFAISLCCVVAASAHLGIGEQSVRSTLPAQNGPSAIASDTQLDIVFPPISIENVGCMYLDSLPRGVERRYQWMVSADYPDRTERKRPTMEGVIIRPLSHYVAVSAEFSLPASTPITTDRLDSALATLRPSVGEFGGEPPMEMETQDTERAVVWREGDQVHLRIQGADAIGKFLEPQQDSVDLGWCQRDEFLTFMMVPLLRRKAN